MLPNGFEWFTDEFDRRLLCVGGRYGTEIARVGRRADGTSWLLTVNRHLEWERRPWAVMPSAASAQRSVSRWAMARQHQIRADLAIQAARPPGPWGVRYAAVGFHAAEDRSCGS